MLNDHGGINGRKINLISLDDGYAPRKTVEQTRRLVESDEVALIFSSIGTAHNLRRAAGREAAPASRDRKIFAVRVSDQMEAVRERFVNSGLSETDDIGRAVMVDV